MVFSSIEFLFFFLPIFLVLYGLTPARFKNMTLLSGSLIFYAHGEPKYLLLLMVCVLVDYFAGLRLGQKNSGRKRTKETEYEQNIDRRRKLWLWAAVAFHAGLLASFKFGMEGRLPLGVSFYTFMSLSYLIDVCRGVQKRETSFVALATFITMFPHLTSGPITKYGEVRDHLQAREFSAKSVQDGFKVFTVGLAFKVLLADRVGLLWRSVQVTGFESISTQLAWLAAAAYSMKIYFDFFGYSLMAMGLGRMLGFKLPENFRHPYMAASVKEFYRRWHITLGRWFREYVYIPLGGNRKGEFRTVCNLLAVWLLTAVWHGGTANFLIWGMLLWLFIVMERRLEAIGVLKALERFPGKILTRLYLWTVIPVTWMCFAITDVGQLQIFLGRMFGVVEGIRVNGADWINALKTYGMLLGAGFILCTPAVQKLYRRYKDTLLGAVVLAALFWFCVWRLQVEGQNPFMYSNF